MIARAHAIELLASEQFDVVVIGGNLTGARIALDAGEHGLIVGLVESEDFSASQIDEARLCLAVLTAAERRGAVSANRLEVIEVVKCDGRVAAVRVRDVERDGCFAIATDLVVNAVDGRAMPVRRQIDGNAARTDPDTLPRVPGIAEQTYVHLATRYGSAAADVLAIAGGEPALTAPIVSGHPDLVAEAVYAARHEQARSVADVLLRRTQLGLNAAPELRNGAAVRVASAIAPELGWSEHRAVAEAAEWAAVSRSSAPRARR